MTSKTNVLAANIAKRAELIDTFTTNEGIVEYRFDLRNVWGDYVIVAVPEKLQSEDAARFSLYQLLIA